MFKKIIAAAFISAVGMNISTADAAVFNGFGVGAGAGVTIATAKAKNPGFGTTHHSQTSGILQILFEYEKSRANCFYWGLGLDASLYYGKNKVYKWSDNLDARFGYNFCNRGVVYGLVGMKLYHYRHASGVNLAPVFGAGGKLKIAKNVSVGLEYKYAIEKKYRHNHSKIDVDSHTILTRVTYHF